MSEKKPAAAQANSEDQFSQEQAEALEKKRRQELAKKKQQSRRQEHILLRNMPNQKMGLQLSAQAKESKIVKRKEEMDVDVHRFASQTASVKNEINLFQVYSNNDTDILPSAVVNKNLDIIYSLLDDNIRVLSTVSKNIFKENEDGSITLVDEDTLLTSEDDIAIEKIFNFNIVDLMPVDTFRGCINSLVFTDSNGVVAMPITADRTISQIVDNFALDTGTSYLSLSLQTPNPVSYSEEQEQVQQVESLKNMIDYIVGQINSDPRAIEPKIFNNLFLFMTMYLTVINQLPDIALQKIPQIKTCLNYITTYLLLLNLFPTFVTFSGSKNVIANETINHTYGGFFNSIFDILISAIGEDTEDVTSGQIETLLTNTNSIVVDKIEDLWIIVKEALNDNEDMDVAPVEVSEEETGIAPVEVNEEENRKRGREEEGETVIAPMEVNKEERIKLRVPRQSFLQQQPIDYRLLYSEPNLTESPASLDNSPLAKRVRVGGSCDRINLRNPLLYVKFLFEWSHDFGPSRASLYVSGYPNFYSQNGVFEQIEKGWEDIIEKAKDYVKQATQEDVFDKTIFNELTSPGKKHDEPTYISSIIDAIMIHCKHMKEDFFYIPVVEFKFTTDDQAKTTDFFQMVFTYFKNQRMFIKPDDTVKEVHLFITSDNTPTDEIPDDKPLGFYMPDMNIENIAISLSNYRQTLYESWDNLDKTNIVEEIFGQFKQDTGVIINNSKPQEYEIKTPARLIDPITPGGFPSITIPSDTTNVGEGERIISQQQSELNNNEIFQKTIYLATIYGINQLLNVWIDNTKVVNSYILNSLTGDNTRVDTITFSTSNGDFDWCVGDTTVNVICGALTNVANNMGNNSFDTPIQTQDMFDTLIETDNARWERIYGITKKIFFHPDFRTLFPKTIQTVLMIISYLKSCGDEYQRLTCEFVNYTMDLNYINDGANKDYLLSYLPDGSILLDEEDSKLLKTLLGETVYLLSKDRILIGEAVEKNTPVYTFLQSPNEAFYDDMELVDNFYEGSFGIKGPKINRKNTGILSNRRKELTSKERNYPNEIEKNITKILKLFQAIVLKGKGIGLTTDQIELIRKDYSLQDFDPDNIELAELKITEQNDKIESLTKIELSMSYYTLDTVINKQVYNNLIDTEIFKAVSLTINSDLLEDIKLKNSCRVPRTISALNSLIHNMYNEPEIVDKLIDSYEKANTLFLQKIISYKTIVETMRKDIEDIGVDPDAIINQYEEYIVYIKTNKSKFSEEIMKIVEAELEAEIRKNSRGSRGEKKSYSDVDDDEVRLDSLMNQIQQKQQQLEQATSEREEESAKKPKTAIKKIKTAIKKTKTVIKEIFGSLKKSIPKIIKEIQNLTKKKQDLEIRISSKTKVFGLETYRKLINILKGGRAPAQGGGKYKIIKNKTKKNKRKKYITKRRRINNKKSIRKNRKHKNKRLTKRGY